ncbi:MAG: Uma2 family endonuclease [Oscillochloridaceae bacterium]|nr:Uma2 family endonuclease [Chloroflexaceae bacterium]MDW8390704.1 Uma2 family endonuclease [Oscillochloridaceae bacterium]
MSATTSRLLTVEEFAALPPGASRRELVGGEVVETMPPGGIHGILAALITAALSQWSRQRGGYVGIESGFVLQQDPATVRAPDVYYVRAERLPETGVPEGFWTIAPDLAVEIVSPSDSADGLHEKVRDYLAAGASAVWVVYPRSRSITVHTPDGLARTYGPEASLESPDLLPGFSLKIADLFR